MQLDELKKPKEISDFRDEMNYHGSEYKFVWKDKIFKFMNHHGFENAGIGSFASVFINDKYPFALKIFRKETGFLTWLEFCKNNQDNPLVPKFKGSPIKVHEDIYAIRVEVLEPIDKMEIVTSVNSYKQNPTSENKLNALFANHIWNAHSFDLTGNDYIDDVLLWYSREMKTILI